MTLLTKDNSRTLEIGHTDTWISLYSTVITHLSAYSKEYKYALKFLESGKCKHKNAMETGRQINLIRDQLARIAPEEAIYDYQNPQKIAPWENSLSPVVTSCANLYLTSDGKDMIFEIVSILCYAAIMETDIISC